MASRPDPDSLIDLQGEIETFLRSLAHPIAREDEGELLDLTVHHWRLAVEFGKLVFEAWSPGRSLARRVEGIAYRDRGRLGVFVRKPGAQGTTALEFREDADRGRPRRSGPAGAADAPPLDRAGFRLALAAMIEREFPGRHLERVGNRSDREFSFSAWYTRGWARQGRTAWAFLGLAEGEPVAASDSVLAFGLIWLDWLREHAPDTIVSGLKLFLPPAAIETIAHRAAYLDPRAAGVEIFEWRWGGAPSGAGAEKLRRIDLKDYGNVQTRLTPRHQRDLLLERHAGLARGLLGDLVGRVDVVPDARSNAVSLRVLGLEVARIEGDLAPRVTFGMEGSARKLEEANRDEFREFLNRVLAVRRARSDDPAHEIYRMQGERWLESLLVRDITRIDPALSPEHVYPQVPAFAGFDRGVIDILSVARDPQCGKRLAVIELKVQEEINLPLQGLDYWLRVKWLLERRQFQEFGYFPGVELAPAPPLLYLVSPAFRFHSTTGRMIRYLDPALEVVQVGINQQWRGGIKALFRRTPRAGNCRLQIGPERSEV